MLDLAPGFPIALRASGMTTGDASIAMLKSFWNRNANLFSMGIAARCHSRQAEGLIGNPEQQRERLAFLDSRSLR